MALDPITEAIIKVIVAEGLRGGFNFIRDWRNEQKELKELEKDAQTVVLETLTLESKAEPITVKSEIDWDNIGSLFWLGNDLMWIKDMMYRGAMPEQVLTGIKKASLYAKNLGFREKSFPVSQLTLSFTIIDSLVGITDIDEEKLALIQQHYGTVEQYIETVKWYIHKRIQGKQPSFEKL